MRLIALSILAMMLVACDDKPPHYLVLCDQKDGQDWVLIDVVRKNGYLMSCTYQSPDKARFYTRACDRSGCNLK